MHRNRGSWGFQPEDTLIEDSGEFPSSLELNGQKTELLAGCAMDVPGLSHRNEDVTSESWRKHRKHVFVLSDAGKPIYSRYGNEEALSSTMGVMMALVSFVQAGGNTIQSIFSDKEAFYAMAECKRKIEQAFMSQNALECVANSQMYCVEDVGVNNLRHFLYKPSNVMEHHRQLPQFTCPEMAVPYKSQEERIRLLDLYRNMHNRIHSTSRPLKLIYHSADGETLLAWVTGKFEMYACFTSLVTKKSAISELTKLLRWIKKEEDRLFICHLPKYSTTSQSGRVSTDRGRSDRANASDAGFMSLL